MEDQAAMLSRLLSVAAAATAATLMGDDHHALSEARSLTGGTGVGDIGAGGEDGSFDGFLRALQNGRIASALRGGNDVETDSPGSPQGPLNFSGCSGLVQRMPRNPTKGRMQDMQRKVLRRTTIRRVVWSPSS